MSSLPLTTVFPPWIKVAEVPTVPAVIGGTSCIIMFLAGEKGDAYSYGCDGFLPVADIWVIPSWSFIAEF